jgi:hypothetical protein
MDLEWIKDVVHLRGLVARTAPVVVPAGAELPEPEVAKEILHLLNTWTALALQDIPGVGPVISQGILRLRPFDAAGACEQRSSGLELIRWVVSPSLAHKFLGFVWPVSFLKRSPTIDTDY